MREFVYGSDAQFSMLDQQLNDGMCHVFSECRLPDFCTPRQARLGFEKGQDGYVMYIDKGVQADGRNRDFKQLLERGEVRFICLEDMVEFFRSLKPLFEDSRAAERGGGEPVPKPPENVVDREKLRELEQEEKRPRSVRPEQIAGPLKEKVFGQDEAIDALAEKIIINRMRKVNKLLSVMLLGPTATGKSMTARSLAEVLSEIYKTRYGYIEISGSEFVGEHTVHRFLGAPPGYVGHGNKTILDPVRKNPHHVIVINEIEKANQKLLESLMEAIDTGILGMADNSEPINLNQSILLFTSNIKIDMEQYAAASEFEKAEMCRDAYTEHCKRPEISGKIGNFLAFCPLDGDAMTNIIIGSVAEELDNYGLRLKRIDERLMHEFKKRAQMTRYGARAIKELVSTSLGKRLLRDSAGEEATGREAELSGTIDNIRIEIC